VGSYAWHSFGWNGVCALGALLATSGVAVLRLSARPAATAASVA